VLLNGLRMRQLKREAGQVLVVVCIALPLFFAVALFVVDGAKGFVYKRQMQNAADAAALAAAREVVPALDPSCLAANPCFTTTRSAVAATATSYAINNDWPGPGPLPQCTQPSDKTCYTWPYPSDGGPGSPSRGKVEVRLEKNVDTVFTGVTGLAPNFLKASARSVANATGIATQSCDFTSTGQSISSPNQYLPSCQITGNPLPGPNAMAFTMSRACDSIYLTGASGGVLGIFGTNGGLKFEGSDPKKVLGLGFNEKTASNPSGCLDPPHPPSVPCTSTSTLAGWQDATDSPDTCVKSLTDLSDRIPFNWLLAPPTPPTPLSSGTPFTASTDYPSKCVDLGTRDVTFTPAVNYTPPPAHGGSISASGPPGIYCLTGTNTTLTLTGDFANQADSSGAMDGYTFFGLNGSKIQVSGNGTTVKFYWPSTCGARPGTRPASFTCFSRTITAYEPQVMFYATNPTHDDGNCANNAICINGQSTRLDGDMFAVLPNTFPPPTPTTTGGTIFMAGGDASAGSGFLEAWWITFQGNSGSYRGTGPGFLDSCRFAIAITNPAQYVSQGCVIRGVFKSTITGANLNMDQ
jgi:hypothetical protein